jgi:hypothetical protein
MLLIYVVAIFQVITDLTYPTLVRGSEVRSANGAECKSPAQPAGSRATTVLALKARHKLFPKPTSEANYRAPSALGCVFAKKPGPLGRAIKSAPLALAILN